MAVAFVSDSVNAEHATANSLYTAPTGIVNGDYLVIYQFLFDTAALPTPTPPTGFVSAPGTWPQTYTQGSNRFAQYCWIKTAASESGNYTVTHTAVTAARGIMFVVSGADPTTPFSSTPTQNSGTNTTTTTFTGLTTTVANELIVIAASDDNDTTNTLTPPSGTTPTYTGQVVASGGEFLASGVLASAGATGSPTMTNNSATGVAAFSFFSSMFPFQPPTGGGPVSITAVTAFDGPMTAGIPALSVITPVNLNATTAFFGPLTAGVPATLFISTSIGAVTAFAGPMTAGIPQVQTTAAVTATTAFDGPMTAGIPTVVTSGSGPISITAAAAFDGPMTAGIPQLAIGIVVNATTAFDGPMTAGIPQLAAAAALTAVTALAGPMTAGVPQLFNALPINLNAATAFMGPMTAGTVILHIGPNPTGHIMIDGFSRNVNFALNAIDGSIAVAPVINNGFLRDSADNLALITTATGPGVIHDGFMRDANYRLIVVDIGVATGTSIKGGFLRDANGFLVTVADSGQGVYHNGYVRDGSYALVTSAS